MDLEAYTWDDSGAWGGTTPSFKQEYTYISDNAVTEKVVNLGLRGRGYNAVGNALLWECPGKVRKEKGRGGGGGGNVRV